MSFFSKVMWKLSSDSKKLNALRKQGLTIGGGARFSTGSTSVVSLTS